MTDMTDNADGDPVIWDEFGITQWVRKEIVYRIDQRDYWAAAAILYGLGEAGLLRPSTHTRYLDMLDRLNRLSDPDVDWSHPSMSEMNHRELYWRRIGDEVAQRIAAVMTDVAVVKGEIDDPLKRVGASDD